MSDEIKEILDYFRKYMTIDDCIRLNKIEDYITNLQEENERLTNIIDKQDRDITTLTKDKIKLKNIIEELEKDINNEMMMTRKFDEYNEGFLNATLHFYNKLKELKEGSK